MCKDNNVKENNNSKENEFIRIDFPVASAKKICIKAQRIKSEMHNFLEEDGVDVLSKACNELNQSSSKSSNE